MSFQEFVRGERAEAQLLRVQFHDDDFQNWEQFVQIQGFKARGWKWRRCSINQQCVFFCEMQHDPLVFTSNFWYYIRLLFNCLILAVRIHMLYIIFWLLYLYLSLLALEYESLLTSEYLLFSCLLAWFAWTEMATILKLFFGGIDVAEWSRMQSSFQKNLCYVKFWTYV